MEHPQNTLCVWLAQVAASAGCRGSDSHDDGDKDGRAQLFEQNVGQGLKHGVRDEEDGQGGIVAGYSESQILTHAGDLSVPDIGTIQEGQEVQATKLYT